ncbi:MAG TPA: carboxypeptidase regulatory-like domain-containing protein [Aridibacter sp.]|nr:carboxypeptidase regulatory-like domain-containing protein [Aridibacter sp.]
MNRGNSVGTSASSRLRKVLSGEAVIIAIFAFVGCFAVLTTPVFGQRTNGAITGTVTDQAGAALSGATVTVSRPAVGFRRVVQSTSEGNYNVPELPAGVYTVAITKDGFRETVVDQVVVNTSTTTQQNVALEVGEVSATVSITADIVQIETQTGAVGEVVSGEQVRELPLNGRSFVQLTQLQPGVSAANNFDPKQKGLFGGVDFSVNGNSAQSNLFLTDGANNNDTGSNRTILLFPSIEAIEEFKVLRNAYGPEYGQAAGAIVSLITRRGSNDFHGSLFYFGRNDALNATEFFANQTGIGKNALRRNDYGGSIGGPIVKDRAFFFFSTEFNKEIRGQSRFGSVPTLLERQGNFSQPRFAPDGTRCSPDPISNPDHPAFATQIIPQGNLSQAGLTLVRIFPEPNIANPSSCNNWARSANSPVNFNEYNIRIDGNINSKNRIFGRFTNDDWSNATPILTGNLWGDDAFPTIESTWAQPSRQLAVKLTTELSAAAINEVQFSYSANRIKVDPGNGGELNAEINNAIPGFFPDSAKVNGANRPHPVFWGGIAPYYSSSGPDLWTQAPFRNSLDIYSIRDDVSWVNGNHTIRFGGLLDKAAKDEDSGPNNEAVQFWGPSACCGDGVFSGNWGNGMLQDLLTEGSRFGFNETSTMAVGQNRYTNFELYFGDSWRVRPNLTLELGARYSIFFEPYDERDLISGFLPSAYDPTRPASDPCNGLVVPAGTNPCSGIAGASTPIEFSNRSLRENSYGNIAPRLGVAWDVFGDGKTAVRGGFGQFFLRERTSIYFASLTQNAPFVTNIAGRRTLDGSEFFDLPAASNGRPQFGLSPEAATPYSIQFNASVARELWKDSVIEVGYVGNRARNQLTHSDVNQVLDQNRVQAAFASDGNAVNAFRPFSNYGTVYVFERNGRSDYDSLQMLFRTKFTSKSSLQIAYTYSQGKADFGLNDSSGGTSNFAVLDRTNRELDLAPSDINRPHIFVAHFIYHLPTLRNANSYVRAVAGGWEFTSIIQVSSGNSVAPILNASSITIPGVAGPQQLSGGITGLGTGVANQRPIRVEGVPCRIDTPKGSFFNPNAWTLEGFRIGETTPQRTSCEGPRTKNVDFSIYKNFGPGWLKKTFGEGARFQFRLEMFNAFNTPQFNGALPAVFYDGQVICGANPCSPTNNVITDFAGANSNFGVATSTRGGREIQYALKFSF